jgi:membrane fusion protein (multidrug efflux system)
MVMSEEIQSRKRKIILSSFFILLAGLGVAFIIVWFHSYKGIRRTSDAYVNGNKIVITPLIDGFVTSIYTNDTYLVEKGQLLIQLDTTNSKLAYEDAKQKYANAIRQVCSMFHQTFAYEAEIQVREAEWIKAEEFFKHRLEVVNQGAVSVEDLQAWEAEKDSAYFSYVAAQQLYQKQASLIIRRSIRENPIVKIAEDELSQAWVNLYRCKIFSPVRGLVAQREAQVGMWVKSGTPLMSVIPLDQIWVNANYKETQMRHMKIGQKVELKADMYGYDVVYRGVIVGLPGGAGDAFSILPPQNLSGNWIKIVQRLPVRVVIEPEDLIAHPLRLGMTMQARVNIRNQSGSYYQKESNLSPIYSTDIYQDEIEQSKKCINSIFLRNADPSLKKFFSNPFIPESLQK